MYKVYLAIPRALDKHLGHVSDDGKVYLNKLGLDQHLGGVDLSSGKVYEDRFGPDKVVGRVDLKSGKVYRSRVGPDEYVGSVDGHGHMHQHVPMGVDEYIGKIEPFISFAHAGGAMLLLVMPALESKNVGDTPDLEDGISE